MRRALILLPLVLLALPALGKRPKPRATAEVAANEPEAPPPVPAPLAGQLPHDMGPLPPGLANPSAQGCHACHVETWEQWSGSAHARGVTPALREAAEAAGTPACLSCHLPLAQQRPEVFSLDPGDVHSTTSTTNPAWSPTLQAEGVTCAACHLRDGVVVGPRPTDAAPHATGWSPSLSQPEACASCHQLTWPGATAPFYDTFGEWQRSGWAKAGVTCQTCHMGPGAGAVRAGADHAFPADPARALSVLVGLSSPRVVRGEEAVEVTLTVQNTGAGHHVPSGSPLTGIRVEAGLVHEDDEALHGPAFSTHLAQTLGDAPPWPILEDTRIPAGGERSWTFPLGLEHRDAPGRWWIEVRLLRTTRGEPTGEVAVAQRVPIRVE